MHLVPQPLDAFLDHLTDLPMEVSFENLHSVFLYIWKLEKITSPTFLDFVQHLSLDPLIPISNHPVVALLLLLQHRGHAFLMVNENRYRSARIPVYHV